MRIIVANGIAIETAPDEDYTHNPLSRVLQTQALEKFFLWST